MTRPMPGPPDTLPPVRDLSRPPDGPDGQFDWDTWRQWKEWDDLEWRTIQAKRLTDAECAAEYWRAMFDAEYETPHGYERQIVIVRTWHRFATRPHALEEA